MHALQKWLTRNVNSAERDQFLIYHPRPHYYFYVPSMHYSPFNFLKKGFGKSTSGYEFSVEVSGSLFK